MGKVSAGQWYIVGTFTKRYLSKEGTRFVTRKNKAMSFASEEAAMQYVTAVPIRVGWLLPMFLGTGESPTVCEEKEVVNE